MKRMIEVALNFDRHIRSFPAGWKVWVAALVLVNAVVPIIFLPTPEAAVTLAVFIAALAHWTAEPSLASQAPRRS